MLIQFFKLCVLVSLGLTLGCGAHKSSATREQGGQDVGGGETIRSSEEDVRFAVQSSIELMQTLHGKYNSNPLRKIIFNFRDTDLDSVAMKIFFPEGWDANQDTIRIFNHSRDSKFEKAKIVWLKKGSCPAGPDKKHADASVSSHKIGADLCLSLENLTKIPKTSLFREILCLLIHESAHLVGYGEVEAVKIQSAINTELMKLEMYYDIQDSQFLIKNNMKKAIALIQKIKRLYIENPSNPQIAFVAAEAIHVLSFEMPDFKDYWLFRGAVGKQVQELFSASEASKTAWATLYYHFSGNGKSAGNPRSALFENINEENFFSLYMFNENIPDSMDFIEAGLSSNVEYLERKFLNIEILRTKTQTEKETPDSQFINSLAEVRWAVETAGKILQRFGGLADSESPLHEIVASLQESELDNLAARIFYPKSKKGLDHGNSPYRVGSYLFKSRFYLVESGPCPKKFDVVEVGSDVCMELDSLRKVPKQKLLAKSLLAYLAKAGQMQKLNPDEISKVLNELEKGLNSDSSLLKAEGAVKIFKENLKQVLENVKQIEKDGEFSKFDPHSPEKSPRISALMDETFHLMSDKMPNFQYSLWFKGNLGPDYEKMEKAIKINLESGLSLFFMLPFKTLKLAKGKPETYFQVRFMQAEVTRSPITEFPKAMAFLKANCEEALRELNQNFPEVK